MLGAAPTTRSARERILDTAGRLFYRDGFQAVGIDTIIAESGVAKMTLYRHFSSKDHLIVAYLERANRQFWKWLEGATAGAGDPQAKLLAVFDAVGKMATSPQCRGCTFQATAGEFPDRGHPAHQVAMRHKRAVREWLRGLARRANLRDPGGLADQLLMLMDGAWVAARMFGPKNPAARAAQAARALVETHG